MTSVVGGCQFQIANEKRSRVGESTRNMMSGIFAVVDLWTAIRSQAIWAVRVQLYNS